MGQIENNICDAINILVNKAISDVKLDKTVLATIEECIDEGAQKYRVKYQDSSFYAYSIGDQKYSKQKQVYVLIPSNDTTEDRLILGTVDKLGDSYINAVSMENRMTKIGCNLFNREQKDGFCSYYSDIPEKSTRVITDFGVNTTDLEQKCYQDEAEYFMIAANFQTMIPEEQKYGQGDYGIIVTCKYYNDNNKEEYKKDYILHVPNMLGQPYQYNTPTRQYAIFQLENQLIDIPQVTLFATNFPISKDSAENDIFISDYEFYYLKALTEDEIAGAALKIETTKTGSVFKKDATPTTQLRLKARLKLSGSLMQETKGLVDYYWFVRDLTVTSAENKEGYYYLGGDYWRCLNPKMDTTNKNVENEEESEFIKYAPDSDEKILTPADCPCASLTFKCVAVMDGFILQDTIIIQNLNADYNITLTSKYGERFSFDNYISVITAQVINTTVDPEMNITSDCAYTWGFEDDNGVFQELTEEKTNKLQHYPSGSHVKYIVTVVSSTGLKLGTAEIFLTNEKQQQNYTLNLIHGNQVFKYSVLGLSPTHPGLKNSKQQKIEPLSFELYDKEGNLVGIREDETGKIVDDRYEKHLFDSTWYFPVDKTMLESLMDLSTFEIVSYNGIEYYKIPVIEETQLDFEFKIKDNYEKSYINNDIILEVKYMDYTCTTSTNFTFTKDGEIGTNGTEYTARLVPTDGVKQIYIRNNDIKAWYYGENEKIQFKTYLPDSGAGLTLELWNGGSQAVKTYHKYDENCNWNIIPNLKSINPKVKYKTVEVTIDKKTYNKPYGQFVIDTTETELPDRATFLQAYCRNRTLSKQAYTYYSNYPLTVMQINSNNNYEYVITGGFDDVEYSSNGQVSNYSTDPFVLTRYYYDGTEYAEFPIDDVNNIEWKPSWEEDKIYTGDIINEIKPPKVLESSCNNYITITINNPDDPNNLDTIILSVYFYFNQYSMDLINGWNGAGVEIGDNHILSPQVGAGIKNDSNNTFTGVVIGKDFDNTKDTVEIGLFGINEGKRTIFLNATNGSATFGLKQKGTGCLQIMPNSNSSKVTINTFEAQPPDWINGELQNGSGGELVFENEKGHFFIGNNFYIDDNGKVYISGETGNVYIKGTVNASAGKVGSWTIDKGSLVGTKNNNTIKLDLDGNYAPSIQGNNDSWYIRGNGTFMLANKKITYNSNKLTIQGNLQGTNRNWHIDETGDFKLAGGALGYNMDDAHPGFYLKADSGSINLNNNFTITYNSLPIQGKNITPKDGDVDIIWTKTCYQYPGLTVVNVMFRCNSDTDDPSIVTGLPKPKHYLYVPIINDDNTNINRAQLTSSGNLLFSGKAIKDRNYYAIFVYTSED